MAKERAEQAKLQQAMKEEVLFLILLFHLCKFNCVIQEKKKLLGEQLPAEPDVGVKDVATIRLRCPDGASLVRRFLGDDKIEVG